MSELRSTSSIVSLWTPGGSTDRRTSRAEYAAHVAVKSGTVVAERLEVSLAK